MPKFLPTPVPLQRMSAGMMGARREGLSSVSCTGAPRSPEGPTGKPAPQQLLQGQQAQGR